MSDPALNPLIVIPARLAATRLPNKPLAMIHGEPMIIHVWRRATAAAVGPVVVACGDAAIAEIITKVGGNAVMTDPALPSGSDRVHAAAVQIDPRGDFNVVINVQGDMPMLEPSLLAESLKPLAEPQVDIATLAAEIIDIREITDPAVVKIALERTNAQPIGRALYFSRNTVPSGAEVYYHHFGIYAFRRAALEAFVTLPQSQLEKSEKLEQLRALAAGMRIDVGIVTAMLFGVDTEADLARARAVIGRAH